MKIGVITAMKSERRQIEALLEDSKRRQEGMYTYVEGRIRNNTIVLMEAGIGKVNAALGTLEMIKVHKPDCIISTGVAGGIDRNLSVMDVIVSSKIIYHDVFCGEGNEPGQVQGLPLCFYGNKTLLDCATGIKTDDTQIHAGLICSGDQFITDPETLYTIKENFPEGLAVDMESGGIAQTCYLYNVPFLSFRIISDTPGVDNHMEQYTNFWESMAQMSFTVTRTFLDSLPESL